MERLPVRRVVPGQEKTEHLNGLGLLTYGGRLWTGDNLRKFVSATTGRAPSTSG